MSDTPSPHEILNTVRQELGADAAVHLLRCGGGERLVVPTIRSNVLPRKFGPEIADLLIRRFGGLTIDLPSKAFLSQAARRKAILNSDKSANSLASELGCTTRWVYQVRSEGERPDNQLTLFPDNDAP